MEITQELVKEFLDYNPDTGVFIWKKRKHVDGQDPRYVNRFNKHTAGTEAGHLSDLGYMISKIGGKIVKLHRMAWLYVHGDMPDFIDHINGDRKDNGICNLRSVTMHDNGLNQGRRKDNRSGYSGLCWNRQLNKWHVRIGFKNKKVHVGFFSDFNDALKARNEKIKDLGYSKEHGVRPSFDFEQHLKRK